MSFKPFTDFTHIVAVKTSGQVYAIDTVEELNKKPKYWKDLMTGTPFTAKDIITIQDPRNIKNRTIKDFHYIRNKIQFEPQTAGTDSAYYINQNQTTKKIIESVQKSNEETTKRRREEEAKKQSEFEEIKKKQLTNQDMSVQEYVDLCILNKQYIHKTQTTNDAAVSVTSTGHSAVSSGQTEFRSLNQDEIRELIYEEIKKQKLKGYATLHTNLGDINLELYSHLCPKACENFLELCEKKYYDNVRFHRLVKDFMVLPTLYPMHARARARALTPSCSRAGHTSFFTQCCIAAAGAGRRPDRNREGRRVRIRQEVRRRVPPEAVAHQGRTGIHGQQRP